MKIARVEVDGAAHLARIEDSGAAVLIHQESSHPAADALREALAEGKSLDEVGKPVPKGDYRLLSPVRNPSKFFGVGLNYRDHAREGGFDVPDRPIFFLKTPNAIVGPGEQVLIRPETTTEVDFEVELALVIGRELSTGDPDEAEQAILGYVVCNDITARDAQFSDQQWPRSKSFDTFGPLGPWIITPDEFDPIGRRLWCDVSGERMQDGTTADLVFTPAEVVSYLARSITLVPGDVITTGTPAGVGFARKPPRFLHHEDWVEAHVDGIGTLRNEVSILGKERSQHESVD